MQHLPDPKTLNRSALLVGAGASLFEPTSLPSGTQLLERAIRLFASSQALEGLVEKTVQNDRFPYLIPEALLQRFGDIRNANIPAEFYAPFREAVPNGLHGWVAAAAAAGCAVLTTNFDLCLERSGAFALHLHGRADEPSTLVHTIVRVGRGIAASVSSEAIAMVGKRPLLIIGYSGNDDDVLALLSGVGAPRIDWIVRNEEDPARVNHARRAGGLPDTNFWNMDLKVEESRLPSPEALWVPTGGNAVEIAAAPSELVQLEMVLAVALELQDYGLAERVLRVEPALLGSDVERCSLLALGSYVERQRGRYDDALGFAARAEALDPGRDLLQARVATEMGLTHLEQEPPALKLAEEELVRAYRLSRSHADEDVYERFCASAVHNLGWLAERQGRASLALRRYRAALGMKRRLGDLTHELLSARDVAIMMAVLRKQGTGTHLERFQYLNAKFGSGYGTAEYDYLLGSAHLRAGHVVEARAHFETARRWFAEIEEWERVERVNALLVSIRADSR